MDWQARGSQAVICTPVIWSMVIIAVCVCVCVFYYEVAIQTNTQCGQSKKKAFPRLTTSSPSPDEIPSESDFSFLHTFFSPLSLGHLSLSLFFLPLPPLPPPLHPYVSPLRSFIPATRAEKPRRHAPSVLRGSNFRFVSDFRLMSVFWLVV